MAFFRVGDIVTVREDLDFEKRYKSEGDAPGNDRCSVAYAMLQYAGKQVTISEVKETPNFRGGRTRYSIEEDGHEWAWTDEMFADFFDSRTILFPDDMEYTAPSKEEFAELFGL